MQTAYPRRRKLRPEGEINSIRSAGTRSVSRSSDSRVVEVAPMNVLEHHQDGVTRCQALDLCQLSV
jgi:hypothetical protein